MLSPSGLQQRSTLLHCIRTFFHDRGYVEVDTPVRLPNLIPEAHIHPITSEGWFLQTSPELSMKMLLARGCRRIFQICPCFRKEEWGRFHRSEFTMLEWYCSGQDYFDLMNECEALLRALARDNPELEGVGSGASVVREGKRIRLDQPWQRLTVAEAFSTFGRVDVAEVIADDRYEEILVERVEPHLGWERPVFLYDYPIELASLARPKKGDPHIAERFELYIGGLELANGFSELVDPNIQRQRFRGEIAAIHEQGRKAEMPEFFLKSLACLEETAGIALGIDRLVMLLMGKTELGEILPFNE